MPRYVPEESLASPRFTGPTTFARLPYVRTLEDVDGRACRAAGLGRLIARAREIDGLWIATAAEIAAHVAGLVHVPVVNDPVIRDPVVRESPPVPR